MRLNSVSTSGAWSIGRPVSIVAMMVVKVGIIIFIIEAAIMALLVATSFEGHHPVLEVVLDATMLTIIASPLIYHWVAKPFATDAAAAREQLQNFTEASAGIHERTLQRIGADLHDGPAQALTFSLLQIDRLVRDAAKSDDTKRLTMTSELREVIAEVALEIRSISTGLLLPELRTMPLREIVELAVHRHIISKSADLTVEIGEAEIESEFKKASIYRVVQESLTNAFKHGKATKVAVRVWEDSGIRLEIADNGTGFDTTRSPAEGLGIFGMRARVLALRGKFAIVSEPNRGTVISAHFPTQNVAAEREDV